MDNLLNFIKRMKRLGLLFAFIVFGLTVLAQSEYVDLGLPSGTYWKKGNVGGDSYIYRKSNYYYTYQEAVKKFGNNLPTKEQYDELLKYCKWERNLKDNDNGYRVVGPNGNFIIMERVGYRTIAGYVTDVEWHAQYWTSTPNDSEAWGFCIFGFNYHLCSCSKNEGHAVRLVISKEEAKKIRQKEREQYRIADCIAREEKRVADSIARERRIADSLEREEKIRQHNLDKEHDAEILQSLSGEWKGEGYYADIKIIVDGNNITLCNDNCRNVPKMQVLMKNHKVEAYAEHDFGWNVSSYYNGARCTFFVRFSDFRFDNSQQCFVIDCHTRCQNCGQEVAKVETLYFEKTKPNKK